MFQPPNFGGGPPGSSAGGSGATGSGTNTVTSSGVISGPAVAVLAAQPPATALAVVVNGDNEQSQPDVSPDGSWVAFAQLVLGADGKETENRRVWRSSTNGKVQPQALSDGAYPTGFPHYDKTGQFLYFQSGQFGNGKMGIIRKNANAPSGAVSSVIVPEEYEGLYPPRVSPSGRWMATTGYSGDSTAVVLYALNPAQKIWSIDSAKFPRWRNDERELVFEGMSGARKVVFSVDAATGRQLTQVVQYDGDCVNPAYSPSGRWIVMTCRTRADVEANVMRSNLFIARIDGSDLKQITTGDAWAELPVWTKQSYIYFDANPNGSADIYRLRVPDAR